MWPNKIQEKIESLDHKAHFYSGIANLIAYTFAFFGFLYGVAKWIEEYFPAFVKFAESHQWVVITLVGWFVATLVLLRQSYISKDLKNTLSRLGLICAENIKASGYSYSERRKIVEKYKRDFLSSRKLYLLGSTGYRTFSKKNDDVDNADNSALLRPIFDQIGNDRSKCSTVNIDILLLHPESTHINARVSDLSDQSTDREKYVNEINYSIAECKELKKRIPNLRCFLYDRPLIWKLIITDTLAWQQFYEKGTHAEHSRLNIFSNVQAGGNALYPPFIKLFELLRDTAAIEVDLNTDGALPRL